MNLSRKRKFKRPDTLEELFADDPFHLLDDVGEKTNTMTVSEKIREKFEEIADFVKNNQKIPNSNSDDFEEKLLGIRFNSLIKTSPEGKSYIESLLPSGDGIRKNELVVKRRISKDTEISQMINEMKAKNYNTIDDIFNDDPFGLLSDVDDKPIEHEYWRDNSNTNQRVKSADNQVAKSKPCKEFYRYERFFTSIDQLLQEGHLKATNVVGDSAGIELGDIFVIDGMMSIIARIYENTTVNSNVAKKIQYRVKQIFANQTETEPYSTSIKSSFYKSEPPSKRIVPTDAKGVSFITSMCQELIELNSSYGNKVLSGYIYILGSMSKNPTIREFIQNSNLVKIGYTTTDVETRISNAENEYTYLYSPVKILKTFKCYNFDPRNLEDALHSILAEHRLNVTLKDQAGRIYHPREWFTVSVDTASQIIEHIFAEDIGEYYIDKVQGKLRHKM